MLAATAASLYAWAGAILTSTAGGSAPRSHPATAPSSSAAVAILAGGIGGILSGSVEKSLRPDLGLAIDAPGDELALDRGDHGAVTNQIECRCDQLREALEQRSRDSPAAAAPGGGRGR